MSTQTTQSAGLSTQLRTFYNRNLLSRLLPNLVYALFGQQKPMPLRSGQTVNFRRFNSLAPATTPLTEGVTPAGNSLDTTPINAIPRQYGDFVEVSDLLDMTAPDPVLVETGELLGEQAAETLDLVVRDVLMAGTTVQYAGGKQNRASVGTGDKLNHTEIHKAVRTLRTNKVQPITSILDASTGVGTRPIAAAYIGIIGPAAHYDLKQSDKFIPVHEYGDKSNLLPHEVGALDEVRFVMTHNPKIYSAAGSGSIDVHATLILGRDAFGVIMPSGVENIIKGFGEGQDPLNQRATSGWKAYFTAVILQQLAMVRIEHAVSA